MRRFFKWLEISFFILAFLLSPEFVQAQKWINNKISAKRELNEDYRSKMFSLSLMDWPRGSNQASPEDVTEDPQSLDPSKIKVWSEKEKFQQFFEEVRDERFFRMQTQFPRRASWLYPDDGCYARAEVVARYAEQKKYPEGSKIYAFGNLVVRTPNAISGVVGWWYHVAVAYTIDHQVFVIDPALSYHNPLLLKDWIAQMGDPQAQVSICSRSSYAPGEACVQGATKNFADVESEEEYFLEDEWSRLLELGRDPQKELGNHPPWK